MSNIPPPPPEDALFGQQRGGAGVSASVPPPPDEAQLFKLSAKDRVDAHGNHPNFLQAAAMDFADNPMVKDASAAFKGAALNGFGGLVARNVLADQGTVGDVVRGAVGVHQRPTRAQVMQATAQARQQAAQEQQDNAQNVSVLGHKFDPVALTGGLVGSADPTLAIPVPGLGGVVGKGIGAVAKRVGANVGAHAAYGSGVDAAYQGADMLDGLQKDFDVDRNLKSAAMMGTLGGLGAAAHEAPDFIKGLFKNRGVDTLPASDPLGKTTPLTGQGLKPEELQQYREVLQTGDVHQIRSFFDGRNVEAPSFETAHEWVKRRDLKDGAGQDVVPPPPPEEQLHGAPTEPLPEGVPPAPPESELPAEHPSRLTADELTQQVIGKPDLREAVTNHITEQTKDWKNKPDYEVINHTDDIQDPAVREAAKRDNADHPDALGFYGADGKVRVFANKIDSPETLNALIYHESLGHHGLAQQFGGRLNATINTLMDRNVGQFGNDVKAYMKDNPGMSKTYAGEEVLAKMSEAGPLKPSLGDAIQAHVRRFGRKMGMDLAYNDAEVRQILAMAHDATVNGKTVAANGFATKTTAPRKSTDYQATDLSALKPEPVVAAKKTPLVLGDPEPEVMGLVPEEAKFMRRERAADTDYEAEDLEGIYKALDRDYIPQTRSFEETRKAALEAGFSPSQIKDLKDVGDISTKLYRMQAAANMADMKLSKLNDILGTAEWTYGHQAEYLKTLADRDYLVNRIKGNRSEIARALNVSKAAKSYNASTMQAVADAMRDEGSGLAALADDPVKFMKFAQKLKALMQGGNKAGANVMIAGVNKPYWEQYLNTFHFNAMLSALSTHVKAPVDMTTGILRNVVEKALAVPIGAVRKGIINATGGTARQGVTANEVAIHAYALGKGVSTAEVYRRMVSAVKDGEGAWVGPGGTAHPINMMNQYGAVSSPNIPIISTPGHLIAAQDTFFRAPEYMANLYSEGMRKAQAELGPKAGFDALNTRASFHAHNPTIDMVNKSKDLTNRTLLLNSNKLNRAIDKYRAYRPGMSIGDRIVTSVVSNLAPFIRVESNSLINRVVQRSPLAFLDPYTLGQLKMGGPEADIALARIAYGTATLGLAWAGADKLTGNGPDNPTKRHELLAAGETPRSEDAGDHYDHSSNLAMSVLPWDKHNSTAQMVKGVREAIEKGAKDKDIGTGLKLATYSVMHELAEMSWVSSMAPLVDAVSADEVSAPGKIARFVADEVKTNIPMMSGQIERMTDVKRDTSTTKTGDLSGQIVNEIKTSIPGLAKTLPVKYSVYGQPLETGQSLEGVHTPIPGFSGNRTAKPKDPTILELNRLAKATPAAVVTAPQRTLDFGKDANGEKVKLKLDSDQFEELQMYVGQTIVGSVKAQMESPEWKSMSDKDKIEAVKDIQKEAKSGVRDALIQKEGWIKPSQLEHLRAKLNGK